MKQSLDEFSITDYAVVLTHNRPEMLHRILPVLVPQVDWIAIVDNASDPPVDPKDFPDNVGVFYEPMQPPNIGKMWNDQLNLIAGGEKLANGPDAKWNVALLCDDSLVAPGWYRQVARAMRTHGASAASTHSYEPIESEYVLRSLSNNSDRLCPWAFMLPGEEQLRADETMHWWYVDTDLDWQARRKNGTLITVGQPVINLLVGDFTARMPDLHAQAQRDGETFAAKWQPIIR